MAGDFSERIEWTKAPDLTGVDLLSVDRSVRRWVVFHETYTLCTCTDLAGGQVEWTYRRKTYRSVTRGLMLLEPGEVHANTRCMPPVSFRVLLIDPSIIYRAAAELGMRRERPQWSSGWSDHAGIFQGFSALHACLETASTPLERESRFVACLRRLLEHCTETGAPAGGQPGRASLLRARDYMREYYSRPVTLQQLAHVSGLSRFHFVRAFAKEFGLPPHAYQLRVQLGRARTLLGLGQSPARVAAETGFSDQSHLTRHFKHVYGATPAQYARGATAQRRK